MEYSDEGRDVKTPPAKNNPNKVGGIFEYCAEILGKG